MLWGRALTALAATVALLAAGTSGTAMGEVRAKGLTQCPRTCPEAPPCPAPSCPAPPPAPPPPPPVITYCKVLPQGYERVPGLGIYKFYEEKVNWRVGQERCAQDGAHLVIPNVKEEADFIVSRMKALNVPYVSIGFNDSTAKGPYKSLLGNALNDFQTSLWLSGYPKRENNWNVLIMQPSGHIRDTCDNCVQSYICELPPL